jgi:putative transposase
VTENVKKAWGVSHEAILNVLYLGLQRIAKNWTAPMPEWKRALNQFAMILGDRVPTTH